MCSTTHGRHSLDGSNEKQVSLNQRWCWEDVGEIRVESFPPQIWVLIGKNDIRGYDQLKDSML